MDIQLFCYRYFKAANATILFETNGYMEVLLPTQLDKELTDRPYYWKWIEAIGEPPKPAVLRLQFSKSACNNPVSKLAQDVKKIEFITLGSFRLNKIFSSIKNRSKITRQYQLTNELQPLIPWLVVPYKISYICDLRKDELKAVSFNLHSGEISSRSWNDFLTIDFSDQKNFHIPILQSGIDYLTAWNYLKNYLAQNIANEDSSWSDEAISRLENELEQIETYYQSLQLDQQNEQLLLERDKKVRVQELKWRTQPKIQLEPLFMAVLYVTNKTSEKWCYHESGTHVLDRYAST